MAAEDKISRVERSHQTAQASYDRLSRWYDALAGRSEQKLIHQGLALLALRPQERVLEIGTGTGVALEALSRQGGRAVGVDLSAGMLRRARSRLGGRPGASLLQAEALQLPVAGGSFDALFMSFTLELFDTPEIPRLLGECRRVLKAGGRLGVVAMSKARPAGLLRLYEWAHQRWPAWIDCRPLFARRTLEEAGFEIVATRQAATWGLPVEVVVGRK